MHGGAVTLAKKYLEAPYSPDLIIATDMLDLTTFLALTRTKVDVPTALYFHENQLTYPWSPTDRDVKNGRNIHYGFINYSSALAADRVLFNSLYHKDSFLTALEPFLKSFPEYNELGSIEEVADKSSVLSLGMELTGLAEAAGRTKPRESRNGVPRILWNHRWEYDKNPEEFFKALFSLADEGLEFELHVLGENFSNSPKVFEDARRRLGERVVHFGYVSEYAEYARLLARSDILPVTSIHDFFGCSVVEAIYMGCYPILPRRLAYQEHLPKPLHKEHFYDDFEGLVYRLRQAIASIERTRETDLSEHVSRYDWSVTAPHYDEKFELFSGAKA